MFALAILTVAAATAMLIATAVAYHIEAGDARRERSLARMRVSHLRQRGI